MSDFLPGLIVSLPLLAAAIIRIPGISGNRLIIDFISIFTSAATAMLAIVACYIALEEPTIQWLGGWEPRDNIVIGIVLIADGFSAGFIGITAILVTAAFLYMIRRYNTHGSFLHMITLIFLGAFSGFVMVGDLLSMFVFLELMGICTYIITAYKIQDNAPLQAGFNVGVIGTVGIFLFLLGVAMFYKIAGTPNIAEAASRLADITPSPSLSVAFALILTGLAIKSGFIPFHFAHADSHSVAPAPHAGLLGAIFVQAILYGIIRIITLLFVSPEINIQALTVLIISAGLLTSLIAGLMSLFQEHLKRMLAFSSIAHFGIAAVGVGLLSTKALAGTGLYVASHALIKMALFLAAGIFLHQFNLITRGPLKASFRDVLPLAAILMIGAFALAGAPPSGLYGGKTFIEEAARELNISWIIYPVYFAAALTGAAIIRFVICLFQPESTKNSIADLVQEGSRETHEKGGVFFMTSISAVLLISGILMVLIPDLVEGLEKTAYNDFDRDRYLSLVMTGDAELVDFETPHDMWEFKDLSKGIISAIIAVLIGVAAARSPDFGSYYSGRFKYLRQLHSGQISDYLAWLLIGTAIFTGWFLFFL